MWRLHNPFRKFGIYALALGAILGCTPDEIRSPAPLRYDIADTVESLMDGVARGSDYWRQELESLDRPTGNALNRMLTGRDFQFVGFSARTQIEALYNLAEASQTGEGLRFLGKLRGRLAPKSAIVDLDSNLLEIASRFSPEDLKRDLAFADPQTIERVGLLRPLPDNVQKAVDLLSSVVAPHDFGMIVDLIERNFRLQSNGESPRQIINGAVMQSSERRAAFTQMIRAHAPPPSFQEATRRLMIDVAKKNAAFAMNEEVSRAISELADEPLPERLRKYAEVSDGLSSRIAQRKAVPDGAPVTNLSDSAARETTMEVLARGGVEQMPATSSVGPSYLEGLRAHAAYGKRIFAKHTGLTRAYSRAIRSSKAGRGVAVGGQVESPSDPPEQVFWLLSRENPAFGRIAVRMPARVRLAATRHLFADSFEAAASVLWDDHGYEADFRDGEITLLLSMDPESNAPEEHRSVLAEWLSGTLEELESTAFLEELSNDSLEFESTASLEDRIRKLLELAVAASPLDLPPDKVDQLYAEYEAEVGETPLGVVVHPALHGSELAWSAARVDFWFNQLDRVVEEGLKLNGQQIDRLDYLLAVSSLEVENVDTWQFYERDSRVSIQDAPGPADLLQVLSRASVERDEFQTQNHFAVSLFSSSKSKPRTEAERIEDEGVWRLEKAELMVQPMLDWASANHHDFMRLNDFSEAFSILRWVDRTRQQMIILDPDGAPAKIAMPDRVLRGSVSPRVGRR